MQQIKRSALPQKYAEELHCNEIMLLPYYIASMNIEHAYMERVGEYRPFEGICLVDTFELSEFGQQSFAFSDSNTARVLKQKKAPIFVVIGNPPYNMGQDNENDENQNRHYKRWDNRIKDTYTKDSQATLRNKLSDPYVKAFRWASDRIRTGGVIAFVTNNSFLDNLAFDGMRKHLAKDFNVVLHLDLKVNARTSEERRRREAGNIFEDQIRVGVGITLLVKNPRSNQHEVRLYQVDDYLKSKAKTELIRTFGSFRGTPTRAITPDEKYTWLNEQHHNDFGAMMPLGSKAEKGDEDVKAMFRLFSLGVASNRDAWVYNSSNAKVRKSIELTLEIFYQEQVRFQGAKKSKFIPTSEDRRIKWTDRLREALENNKHPPVPQGAFETSTLSAFRSPLNVL